MQMVSLVLQRTRIDPEPPSASDWLGKELMFHNNCPLRVLLYIDIVINSFTYYSLWCFTITRNIIISVQLESLGLRKSAILILKGFALNLPYAHLCPYLTWQSRSTAGQTPLKCRCTLQRPQNCASYNFTMTSFFLHSEVIFLTVKLDQSLQNWWSDERV